MSDLSDNSSTSMLNRILVFGGSSGLGFSFVQHLAEQRIKVSAVGRRLALESYKDNLNIDYHVCDLLAEGVENDLRKIFEEVRPDHIAFFLRHRADDSGYPTKNFPEFELAIAQVRLIIDCFEATLGSDKSYKSLLFCSSLAAHFITSSQGLDYHISKSAMEHLARFYAVKLGKKGVRVNSITPNYFLKKRIEDLPEHVKEKIRRVSNATPLGYIADMKEICRAAQFLLSRQASYVTGQNLVLDGGLSLRLQDDLLNEC